ncbi:hypothetical protein [Actinoplanes sp. NPDC048796]|uniref:hypothetical protein n=1 Tax=unclassified Actinoplanes TaxID=2626549 RepID=UPI0033E3BB31
MTRAEAAVPEIWPEHIEWDDHNLEHATRHGVSAAEVDQVLNSGPKYYRNRKGRSGDLVAIGLTRGGRTVVVVVEWRPATAVMRPITAWEEGA